MKIKDFFILCSIIGIATAVQTIDRRCLDCMCQASSSCNLKLRCHNAADGAYYCGPYQISWAYWADAGKPGSAGFSNDFEKCLVDQSCAERTIAGYMSKWASDCNGDGQIDCLDFAAIHRTGPTAQCNQSWLKNSKYWTDFNRCYASSVPSHSSTGSSGFTGSTNFPSNNHNHEVEIESAQPANTGVHSYAISSSDPRPISRTRPEIALSALSSSSPLSPISSTTSTFSSPSHPASSSDLSSSHYSSSSSYSNYTEVTEESSSGIIDPSDYESSRSSLPGRTIYETLSNLRNNPARSRVVEGVIYEQPSSVRTPITQPAHTLPTPAPAPIRVDVRPISNDYVVRENAASHTSSNPTSNYVYEQPASPQVQPSLPVKPVVPVSSVSSFAASSIPSVVPETCLYCLCQASSKCELNKGCDGAYCGPYLLSWAYWTDGGKPGSNQGLDYPTCSRNQSCAEQAVNGYMSKWTRDCNNDGVVDCTDFALIHKLGPHGCGRLEALKSTGYWNRFESCYGTASVAASIEPELPSIQPVAPHNEDGVENVVSDVFSEVSPIQPEVRRQPEVTYSSNYSPSQPARNIEPAFEPRRNDFHEQPLHVPRPQPSLTPRRSNGASTSNIRISFNNREIVNTALQDTPIIHNTPPQPQPVRSSNSLLSVAPTNSFIPRTQEYPPRSNSAFSTEVVPETPSSSNYVSNPNSDSNIREVPANNDNTGFDDSSFSGRSAASFTEDNNPESRTFTDNFESSESSNFNPFAPLNKTEDEIVTQECLNCMCHAASRCEANIGCKSDSSGKFVCGVYQVDWEYWSDAGKPGNRADLSNLENFQMCLNDRKCADETIRGYMRTHRMDCNDDGRIDCHDYSALHIVGPQNCKAKWYLDSKYHSDFNECISF